MDIHVDSIPADRAAGRGSPSPYSLRPPKPPAEAAGCVELVTERSVTGWVANVNRPDRLEPVVAIAPNGDRLSFQPFIPRPDVCAFLRLVGRFGFSIPTAALRALGPVVSFVDSNNAPLKNGHSVTLPPPVRDLAIDRQTWIFLHVPKTAGTSIRNALECGVAHGEAVFLYPDAQSGLLLEELANMKLVQRAALRLVMGHVPFGVDMSLPNAAGYVTFLRSPASRLRSNFFHHADQRHRFLSDGIWRSVEDAVTHGLSDEFDNLMVRLISGCGVETVPLGHIGERHVAKALAHIRSRFRFVGLVEQLGAHYDVLCRTLGIAGRPLRKENARQVAAGGASPDTVDWEAVMHRNRFDTLLYQQVVAQGLAGRALSPQPAQPTR